MRYVFMMESSLGAFWIAKNASFLHMDKEAWSDCRDAQADLSFYGVHMLEATFVSTLAFWLKIQF